jgi:hypothetical protein
LETLIGNGVSPAQAEQEAAATVEANQALKAPDENESSIEEVQNRQGAAVNKGSVTQAQ